MSALARSGAPAPDLEGFLNSAVQKLGRENVLTGEAERLLHSVDFSEIRLSLAEAVVRPGGREDVAALMQAARRTGVKLTARGGGMSYTLGYAPRDPGTIVLDMTRMKAIDIRLEDKLVIVETGVTWAELAEKLRPTGYQIGCMGTMSGIAATIGGGLGNNATGHGRGDITDDLLGMEIVTPEGEILLTGAFATNPAHPVLRGHGPDFTGLFTHDAGALGVKTKAAFRLMRRPGGEAYACYGFQDTAKLIDAMCAVERLDVAANNIAFGRYHHRVFATQKASPQEMKAMAKAVMDTASSRLRGVRELAMLGRPGGMSYLLNWRHSTFTTILAHDQAGADRMAREAGRAMAAHGGVRLPTGLGVVMRAQPYVPIETLMVGIEGECTFPSNCGVVLSQAHDLNRIVTDFFAANEAEMQKHNVTWTALYLTPKGGFGIEPIIYWHDRPNALRMSKIAPERRARFEAMRPDEETRAYAVDLRKRLVAAVDELKPYHFQVGKYYDYRRAIHSPPAWRLLEQVKAALDPEGRMNPGGLGLN